MENICLQAFRRAHNVSDFRAGLTTKPRKRLGSLVAMLDNDSDAESMDFAMDEGSKKQRSPGN